MIDKINPTSLGVCNLLYSQNYLNFYLYLIMFEKWMIDLPTYLQSSRLIKAKKVIEKPKMTCIIGRVCEDGVVLIADRKVTYDNGNVTSEDKIFCEYYPFVIASSGYIIPFRNFIRDSIELAQNSIGKFNEQHTFQKSPFDYRNVSGISFKYPITSSYPVIRLYPYLIDLGKIVKESNNKLSSQYHFDVLIATQNYDSSKASLHHIDEYGTQGDIYDQTIIGSGNRYASFFLKPFLKSKFTMEKFAELGFFVMKYIDRFRIDDKVGLLEEFPLVWFIPHSGRIGKIDNKNLLENGALELIKCWIIS